MIYDRIDGINDLEIFWFHVDALLFLGKTLIIKLLKLPGIHPPTSTNISKFIPKNSPFFFFKHCFPHRKIINDRKIISFRF